MLYYLSKFAYTARTEEESVSARFLVGMDSTYVETRTLGSRSRIDNDSLSEVLLNLEIARSRLQRLGGFWKIRLWPWCFLSLGCCLFCRFCMFVGCLVLLLGFGGCCFDVELSSERALALFEKNAQLCHADGRAFTRCSRPWLHRLPSFPTLRQKADVAGALEDVRCPWSCSSNRQRRYTGMNS